MMTPQSAQPVAVINVVGLTRSLLPHAPRLSALGDPAILQPVLPAVTCSVQASMLTGKPVEAHGIVANGWYDRDQAEVRLWARSGKLIQAPCVWDAAKQRDPAATCANLFWRHAAYTTADHIVIERPIYRADGRKLPDCYANRPELRDMLQQRLGPFPLFHFWGPFADIRSSQWIADATRLVYEQHRPTLTLTYLPHLDYPLQKLGPDHPDIPGHVRQINEVAGDLIDYFQQQGVRPIVVSEYGIERVDRVIEINRALRRAGRLAIREECGGETLDCGASEAFAVADHQVAHVYLHPRLAASPQAREEAESLCRELPGVETVHRMAHRRAGEFVLEAEAGAWFTYDWWLDDARAPDFAPTIDIHRKPGYDPRELFCAASRWKLLRKLIGNKLGLRQRFDIIPLDPTCVRGSHGRTNNPPNLQPLCLPAPPGSATPDSPIPCSALHDIILQTMFGD
jgi:predicted AlkP superfamily pyrophosphatase or phosphodiesterase